jgi:hypothetical protein
MMWRLSLRSSPWRASVLELLKAGHGTRPHKLGPPRRVVRVPFPGMAERKRRVAATRSRSLPRWSSQLRPGAGATATNAHSHKGVTATRALYIPTVATAPRSVARSLISQNASANAPASDVNSLPETAHRPGKEKVDDGEVAAAEQDLGYQSPEGDLKDVFAKDSHSDGDD